MADDFPPRFGTHPRLFLSESLVRWLVKSRVVVFSGRPRTLGARARPQVTHIRNRGRAAFFAEEHALCSRVCGVGRRRDPHDVQSVSLHYWMKLFPRPGSLKTEVLRRLKRTRLDGVPINRAAGNLTAVTRRP